MRSIIVVGDCRLHRVKIHPSREWADANVRAPEHALTWQFFGGAYIVREAIASLINQSKTSILSYKWPSTANDASGCSDIREWTLLPMHLSGIDNHVTRLSSPTCGGRSPDFHDLERDLLKKLINDKGTFAPRGTKRSWQEPCTPDILVVDDLNLGFRKLTFETPFDHDGDKFGDFSGPVARARDVLLSSAKYLSPPKTRQSARTANIQKLSLDSSARSDSRSTRTLCVEAALTLLCERFSRAYDTAHTSNDMPVMEPVIVGSIVNDPHLVFTTNNSSGKETLWSVLHKHKWLRERTIIILDVADLRLSELSISTGLSWERTAQDTIVEMRRSASYRKFFDFGQVIVRFGVTGALHIVRRDDFESSYYLFFDPQHDDTAWTNSEYEGTALGSSALFIASILEKVSTRCKASGGHPFLNDLPTAVKEGLFESVGRSIRLTECSYGNGTWEQFYRQLTDGRTLPQEVFRENQPNRPVVSWGARIN